jgi:glycosyltransferase involved in cell wall biosynthesis
MAKRILLGCQEIPGWGGAATTHYRLFELMQREGWDVGYVNLVNQSDARFLRPLFGAHGNNPRSLANVHTFEMPPKGVSPDLAGFIATTAPDLMLACGFTAALPMKHACPDVPLAFVTAGAREVQHLIETGAVRDYMGFVRGVAKGIDFTNGLSRESEAVSISDVIFAHSPIIRFAFEHLYPDSVGKIYANTISVADLVYSEAEEFSSLRRPFAERDVDVAFIASSWQRPVKNYAVVQQIVHATPGLTVHIVGDAANPPTRATPHGVLTRREDVFALLGRCKAVVCPSLLDAAPGILFEASAMGCNVVASPNCGNWQLCHRQLLARRCTPNAFVERIGYAMERPYPDNRKQYCGGYADLLGALDVF